MIMTAMMNVQKRKSRYPSNNHNNDDDDGNNNEDDEDGRVVSPDVLTIISHEKNNERCGITPGKEAI